MGIKILESWSAPLLLLTYALSQSSAAGLAMVFYGLALVFNYPHFMATIYRAYGTREDFSKYRVFTVHATALLILTAILTHTSLKLLPWVFTLYINWSPWHYSGQNYGLLMMFARRNEAGCPRGRSLMTRVKSSSALSSCPRCRYS